MLLASDDIKMPKLEVVFTANEEVSMEGAMNLDGSHFEGRYIINLDSEEEGRITVSCAGGVTAIVNIPKELIGLIIVKPLSGSGALGVYAELVQRVGIDSLTEQMGATIVGASETIFYTMAIYYGSLKIKDTGYTLFCSLLCHIAGVLASVYICYLIL